MPKVSKTYFSSQGYTLIEVLIAMFIFVIIMATIGFSLIYILKNIEILKKTENEITEIQLMLTLVNFDLNQVVDKEAPGKGSFYTSDNKLHFIKTGAINPANQFNRSNLEEVEYQLENNNFIRAYRMDDDHHYKKQSLLTHVTSLKWIFIDDNNHEYTLWPPTQDWQYNKPKAVKLRIETKALGPIEKIVDTARV